MPPQKAPGASNGANVEVLTSGDGRRPESVDRLARLISDAVVGTDSCRRKAGRESPPVLIVDATQQRPVQSRASPLHSRRPFRPQARLRNGHYVLESIGSIYVRVIIREKRIPLNIQLHLNDLTYRAMRREKPPM